MPCFRGWWPLCWLSSDEVLSASLNGDIYSVDLRIALLKHGGKESTKTETETMCRWAPGGGGGEGHSRLIFALVQPTVVGLGCEQVKSSSIPHLVLSIGLDRRVSLWAWRGYGSLRSANFSDKTQASNQCTQICWSTLTLGGFAYSIAASRGSSPLIAIGGGDRTIRLWTVGVDNALKSRLLWRGLREKVTCVEWHPTFECRCCRFDNQSMMYGN